MAKINPDKDGVDHINIYSKGFTELGQLLSNFAHTPFELPNVGKFQSVEGYWYWLLTKDDSLKELHGYAAKQYGRRCMNLAPETKITKDILKAAYIAKLEANPNILEMLKQNTLPLKHYYMFDGRVHEPEQYRWTAELWNEVLDVFK